MLLKNSMCLEGTKAGKVDQWSICVMRTSLPTRVPAITLDSVVVFTVTVIWLEYEEPDTASTPACVMLSVQSSGVHEK